MTEPPAVAIDHVWKFYGDFPALRDISAHVRKGSCTALLGRNGAGKTTLLRILAGLSRAAKGQVSIFGEDVRKEATRRRVGVLGHAIGIYEEMTASENLRLFARLYGLKDAETSSARWLEKVGLERVADGLVREFSRGMRQRLAVARAFLHDPDVLLLDEPFTALDDKAIAVLQSVLKQGLSEGRTVVMSTHQLREALELATDVLLVSRGKLAYHGERTREMLEDPGYLYRAWGEA
ncbi:MAG TPA: heme ABC exporter ATP-binding protein CcmA [Bryobacteraceae bacterium]|nr:heme ABC exporter ATP-binding protein CcmA [Bryobacteraceae bacterium]